MVEDRWRVWVDTGGTFTDCLAVDPAGGRHSLKVLSSSAVRGRIEEVPAPRTVRVSCPWRLQPGFFDGARVRVVGGPRTSPAPGVDPRVLASPDESTLLELDDDLADEAVPGSSCELCAPFEAPLLAAHLVTRTPLLAQLPAMDMRLATTRATNALLQRRGAPTALLVTEGFRDLLAIGTQQRPDLFALDVLGPPALHDVVVEVPGRLAADGSEVCPLRTDALRGAAEDLVRSGFRCAAVALMHSHLNPSHEASVEVVLREAGFDHVVLSSQVAPFIRIIPRAQTTVVEAFLAPVVSDYLRSISSHLSGSRLLVMTSAGGLVGASSFRACDALLSGPAGGVVGASVAGRRAGFSEVISFDMGGTSTDVGRWGGDFEYVFEHEVGGVRLVAPALALETVAAGGGSICSFELGRLTVGPESAGADPGPACYGAGGPLTLTDVNLLLGRIAPERFPIPVDPARAAAAFDRLADQVASGSELAPAPEALLAGFLQIANERMANAIRRISIRRGYDPSDHALVAFGGAGPQHACAVAALLGIDTVVVPLQASLLSADGLRHALVERFSNRQVLMDLAAHADQLPGLLRELETEAVSAVVAEGLAADEVVVRRRLLSLRLWGQETSLAVEWQPEVPVLDQFEEIYTASYGYPPPRRRIEIESARVIASSRPRAVAVAAEHPGLSEPQPLGRVFRSGPWQGVPIHDREDLDPGAVVQGPALVLEDGTSTVVENGWRLHVDGARALVLQRRDAGDAA